MHLTSDDHLLLIILTYSLTSSSRLSTKLSDDSKFGRTRVTLCGRHRGLARGGPGGGQVALGEVVARTTRFLLRKSRLLAVLPANGVVIEGVLPRHDARLSAGVRDSDVLFPWRGASVVGAGELRRP